MSHLQDLDKYLEEKYGNSIFDQVLASQQLWTFHLHGHRLVRARILENMTYDLKVDIEDQGEEELPKIQVKFLYPPDLSASVQSLVITDAKVKRLELEPIIAPGERFHVKNKSLFPLMKEKEVVLFTLLEGEVIRGVVADFTRYDLTVNLKGGLPVTILRHSVYDLRNKKGRCFLKSFQDKRRDWEKSPLFVQ